MQYRFSKKKRPVTPNVLIIDNWRIIQNPSPDEDLPLENWDSVFGATQLYLSEFVIKNFKGKLKAVFDRLPKIVFDGKPQPVTVKINNKKITRFKRSEFLDHDMVESDIKEMAKKEISYIEIKFEDSIQTFEGKTGIETVSMLWDSAYIVGNFTLKKERNAENKYAIVNEQKNIKPGSWSSQGYPFLSGAIEYKQDFNISAATLKNRVFFF